MATLRRQVEERQFESDPTIARLTRAVVDLHAIAANVTALRQAAPNSMMMTVVKANGYGHGAVEVARAALAAGATWLGVYTTDEGAELRRHGIAAPILVFGPFSGNEAKHIVAHQLTPTITSVEGAEKLQHAAAGMRIPFHLKVDTGLIRAGASVTATLSLLRHLQYFSALVPEGIYTHFASADEEDAAPTILQVDCFQTVLRDLDSAGFSFLIRHTANSAATLNFPCTHFDMVRCGISTYGYDPSEARNGFTNLRPALSLLSTVSRVTSIPTGTGVGYGHAFRAPRRTIIALVPIGYGDGVLRSLGLGAGRVIIRSQLAPIVGRVSMDQITVDVTDIPQVRLGDQVTLIGVSQGVQQTADDLARQAGTIQYEILSSIMPRVPRVYIGAPKTGSAS